MSSDINKIHFYNSAETIITNSSMPSEIKQAMLDTLVDKFSYNAYAPEHMISLFVHDYLLFKTLIHEREIGLNCMDIKGKYNNVSPAIVFLFSKNNQFQSRIKNLFPEHFSLLDVVKEFQNLGSPLTGYMQIPEHTEKNNQTLLEQVIMSYQNYPIELIHYLNDQKIAFNDHSAMNIITRRLSQDIKKNTAGQEIDIKKELSILDILNQRGVNPNNIYDFYELDASIQKKIIKNNPAFNHKELTKKIVNNAKNNAEYDYVISIINKLDTNQFITMFPALPERKQQKFLQIKIKVERNLLESSIEPKKYSNQVKDRI